MDVLYQVRRRRRTEKIISPLHDVTGRVATSLVKRKGLDIYLYYTSLTMMLLLLVAIFHHIQIICVSMTIAQCQLHLG